MGRVFRGGFFLCHRFSPTPPPPCVFDLVHKTFGGGFFFTPGGGGYGGDW